MATPSTTSQGEWLHDSDDLGEGGAEDGESISSSEDSPYMPSSLSWLADDHFQMVRKDGRDACLLKISLRVCEHIDVSVILEAIEEVVLAETAVDDSLLVDPQGREVPVTEYCGYLGEQPLKGGATRKLHLILHVLGDWRPNVDDRYGILFDDMFEARLHKKCDCRHQLSVDLIPCREVLDSLLAQPYMKKRNIGHFSSFEDEVRARLGPYQESRRYLLRRGEYPEDLW